MVGNLCNFTMKLYRVRGKGRVVLTEGFGEVGEHPGDGLLLLLLGELPMLSPLVPTAPLLVFERAAVVHSATGKTGMPQAFSSTFTL